MAYYAKLQDSVVQQIIVVSDTINDGAAWCTETFGGEWVECNDGGIGWTYSDGVFMAPQPFPSWTWENKTWNPPTPMPSTGGPYRWSEEDLEWVAI